MSLTDLLGALEKTETFFPCQESNTNSSITPPYSRNYNLPTAHFRFQNGDEEKKYL